MLYFNFLDLQDACRKRIDPSQVPGEWVGTMIETVKDQVNLLISQKKWDKAKAIIRKIIKELEIRTVLNRKQLERDRGFLIYMSKTYWSMISYLKAIHLSLDSWREGKGVDGWKKSRRELLLMIHGERREIEILEDADTPKDVAPVPQLLSALKALEFLLEEPDPRRIQVRLSKTGSVSYGNGDASGSSYGADVYLHDSVSYRYGQWSSEVSEETSNYRELRNLVDTVEKLYPEECLKNCELLLFTDNILANYAYLKGTLSTKALFNPILRLKRLQMTGDFILHLIHISGDQMIDCGVNSL